MVVAAGAQGVSDVVQCIKDIIKHKVSGTTCLQLLHEIHINIYRSIWWKDQLKTSLYMLECVHHLVSMAHIVLAEGRP